MFRVVIAFLCLCVVAFAEEAPLRDLIKLPQEATYYLPKRALPAPPPEKLKSAYLQRWYAPWTQPQADQDRRKIFWALDTFSSPGYARDGKPNDPQEIQRIYQSMDTANYPSVAIRAVVLTDTNVRAVPTDKPYYRTKDDYPFDQWQNSMIFAGTPVLITHYNTTKTYAHIQSSFIFGWVRIEDIAPVRAETIYKILELKDYLTPLQDKVPLYDKRYTYLDNAHMGEIFPRVPHTSKQVYIYSKDSQGFAKPMPITINLKDFTSFPRPLTPQVMAAVIDTMLGQKYGWGGVEQKRDCSAFTRDSFASFGIFLPRNSFAQVQYANNAIDLSRMSAHKKEAYIIKHATPFATILWLKGHIMLYLGVHHKRVIVAHNIWSVSVDKSNKRNIYNIEKAVITTLKLGKEHKKLFAQSNLLIDRVGAMSDLYDYSLKLVAH
ncbi:SH3 domain-containing protein [Helicobacter baculiformis]|uniref:SH3 domain-containing protein n=1 Tax=Helicobacter baculiformis TaxID=427351 RepID=A0ABV7ZHX5_9HELI|nr:SH3 domain-containing C40 family peptidase [Helicobacter baculiformis]